MEEGGAHLLDLLEEFRWHLFVQRQYADGVWLALLHNCVLVNFELLRIERFVVMSFKVPRNADRIHIILPAIHLVRVGFWGSNIYQRFLVLFLLENWYLPWILMPTFSLRVKVLWTIIISFPFLSENRKYVKTPKTIISKSKGFKKHQFAGWSF